MTEVAGSDDVCQECGFALAAFAPGDAATAIRAFGRRYRAPLTRFLPGEDGNALVRERPAPEIWSALEYAAHLRDVFEAYDEWVRRSLVEDLPSFDAPNVDAKVQDDPGAVVDALAANADRFATTLDSVGPEQWDRAYLRHGEARTVAFTAVRAVHEGNHHLLDIGRGLRRLRDERKGEKE